MRILAAVAWLLMCLPAFAESRTWKSAIGQTIEAEYVKYSCGMVILKTPEGKQIGILLSRLSKEDQAYVKSLNPQPEQPETPSTSKQAKISGGNPQVVGQMAPGKTLTRKAEGETGITYHVYVPTSFRTNAPPPIIISFSPGGSGRQMIDAIRASAEKAGWLLVGCDRLSNNTKGDIDTKMGDEVLDDILKNIPYQTERIYLAGFSGGAYRCYSYASDDRRPERFAGILAFGGWIGGRERQKREFVRHMAVAQINGDTDKGANTWTKGDARALERDRCEVREFKFPGGHKIAPPEVIDDAIAWLDSEWQKRH